MSSFRCSERLIQTDFNFFEKEVDRRRRIRYTITRSKAAADAEQLQLHIGELCNGSTYDSDSYCLGSNPSSPAIRLHGQAVKTLPSQGKIMGSIPIGGATKQNDCVLFFYLPEMSTSEILRKFRFPCCPSLRHLCAF